ncbi:MAG TPA: ATPase, partial [Nocardioidaceae bacterium]|nr:ATPase [Nocardioidaceae bacterium]
VRRDDLDADTRDRAVQGELSRARIRADLEAAGLASSRAGADRLVDELVAEAREHAERRAVEDEQRKRINGLDVPSVELPRLPDGIDLGGLYELADRLRGAIGAGR